MALLLGTAAGRESVHDPATVLVEAFSVESMGVQYCLYYFGRIYIHSTIRQPQPNLRRADAVLLVPFPVPSNQIQQADAIYPKRSAVQSEVVTNDMRCERLTGTHSLAVPITVAAMMIE